MRSMIHREGVRIIWKTIGITGLLVGLVGLLGYFLGGGAEFLGISMEEGWFVGMLGMLGGMGILLTLFFCWFFREPSDRGGGGGLSDAADGNDADGVVLAPADGKVVAIEEVLLDEVDFLKGKAGVQVSIFMSVWNVHINWFPVGGVVEYVKHHPGKFLVAWHPKSSTDNERTTTVVRTASGHCILFRQIAGFVARRIVNYAVVGDVVERAGRQCGFIKFGSRVDLFLPVGSRVQVRLGDRVVGTRTRIATLPGVAWGEGDTVVENQPNTNEVC